ncbi:MAG TPA: helix-turn-helix transcriptional regulator [Pseudolysinimonas sp.]|nr:helix-turn-helix transcriptional regulator [Pseudolysinimonas sp.]
MPAPKSEAFRMLGERFRAERLRVGLTQMDLSNLAGMNVANYGKIERGLGNPNFETLVRLAGVLGIDPGRLLSGMTATDLPPTKQTFTAAEFIKERERHARGDR